MNTAAFFRRLPGDPARHSLECRIFNVIMLAASAFSLILPGIEAAEELFDQRTIAAAIVVFGLGLGTLLMLGLDYFTPHQQASETLCGPECQRLSGIWLFIFAIALHNLPEGMAIGISFTHGDFKIGLPLTIAIAIQDVPEGFAVALALRSVGLSPSKAFLIGAATGMLEPLGAILGFAMSSSLAWAYPMSMGLAAGAMIFVVCHEVIPETHRNGYQGAATTGLMIGFAVMMFNVFFTNMVVSAADIHGPWSEPVDLKVGNFDPGHAVAFP